MLYLRSINFKLKQIAFSRILLLKALKKYIKECKLFVTCNLVPKRIGAHFRFGAQIDLVPKFLFSAQMKI